MARRCDICGKKGLYGSNISHSHRVTKRRQFPNLQGIRANIDGKVRHLLICTRCLKSGKVEKVTRNKA